MNPNAARAVWLAAGFAKAGTGCQGLASLVVPGWTGMP